MLRKAFSLHIKALSEQDGEGVFEGYASTFSNIDRGGDIVVPGAFKDDLPRFLSEGVILYQHDTASAIGRPLEAAEDAKGLYLKGSLVLDVPKGRECYTLMKAGVVKTFSIGYDIVQAQWLTPDNIESFVGDKSSTPMSDIATALDWGRALQKLTLYEVSPVSIPMNPKCDLTNVKDATLRAGMRFDEFSELVRAASEELVRDAKKILDLRAKEGRTLSDASRARLGNVLDGLKAAHDDLSALLADTAKTTEDEKAAVSPDAVRALKANIIRQRAAARSL